MPGPLGIWDSEWVDILASPICPEDVVLWPCTTGLFVKWVSFLGSSHWPVHGGDRLFVMWVSFFLGSLHWPARGLDLRVGGVSHSELPILYELWAGERLSLEKATPRYLRPGRPISVSAVPFGPGIDIWRSCRFIGAMMRSLFASCLVGLVGLCLALLVLIIAGFVILVGRGAVMVLLLGLGRVPLSFS